MKLLYNAAARRTAPCTLMSLTQQHRSNPSKTLIHGVKLTALLLLVTSLQVSTKTTYAQKMSLSLKNGPLETLFAGIGKKTGYVFS